MKLSEKLHGRTKKMRVGDHPVLCKAPSDEGVAAGKQSFGRLLMKKRLLKFSGASAVLVVLLTGLGFAFPQWFLCVENRDVKAELYASGAAPKILLTGDGDDREHRAILLAAGVPPEAILLETHSRTTKENAEYSASLLKEKGINTAIVATSWYHSRRALAAFEHFAPAIRFYSRPSHYAYVRADWKKAGIRRFVWEEYPKLMANWVRYGIAPF